MNQSTFASKSLHLEYIKKLFEVFFFCTLPEPIGPYRENKSIKVDKYLSTYPVLHFQSEYYFCLSVQCGLCTITAVE